MAGPAVPTVVVDPDGHRVDLDLGRWQHIEHEHPELAGSLSLVLRAVEEPSHRRAGRTPDEQWYYLSGVGPSRWIRVVVLYATGRGRIITTFARRRIP